MSNNDFFQRRFSIIFSQVDKNSNIDNFQFLNNSICQNKIGKFEPSNILNIIKEIKFPFDTNIMNKRDIFNYTPNKIKIIEKLNQKNENFSNNNNSNQKDGNNKNIFSNHLKSFYPFTLLKKKRFITTSKNYLFQKSNVETNSNSKYKIIINKMVKRLIEENILFEINNSKYEDKFYNISIKSDDYQKSESKETKTFKNSENDILDSNSKSLNDNFSPNEDIIIKENFQNKFVRKQNLNYILKNIYFEESKCSNIKFNYLLNDFNDEIDNSFNFNDCKLITKYNKSKLNKNNKYNNIIIDFGENPVEIFIKLLNNLNNEVNKEKNEQTKKICDYISKEMNLITSIMSTFPILLYPKSGKYENLNLFNKITKKKKSFNNSENKIDDKKFICDICNEIFTSGQGLGGHMSRKHKDQSMKFKHKKEIRNKREPLRNILVQAKKILCKNHLIDYDEQMRSKDGKTLIKSLVIEYNEEFKKIRNELKKNILIK
jgi:hypothetical protein